MRRSLRLLLSSPTSGGLPASPATILAILSLMASQTACGEKEAPLDQGKHSAADAGGHDAGALPCPPEGCPAGSYCAENGRCLEGCTQDEECTAAGMLCDPATHRCAALECVADAHCPPARPRCHSFEGRCGCGRSEDCEAGESCTLNGWCVPAGKECTASSQCTMERICTPDGWCVPPGLECRSDLHCPAGEHCSQRGFCVARGLECEEEAQCRPDKSCNAQGFCVTIGTECDRTEHCPEGKECNPLNYCVLQDRSCDLDLHCPPGWRCEDDSGACVPTASSCQEQGCPAGQACNRFGLCAPIDRECAADGQCPAGQRCRETGFCVPQGAECNDEPDCGDAGQTCNPFGACVSRFDDLPLCGRCVEDSDCRSPTGVCFDASYTDGQGQPPDERGVCLRDCQRDDDCAPGMSCFTYQRAGRPASVCRPRTTTCAAFLAWAGSCLYDSDCGPQALCRDLRHDIDTASQCTWSCSSDADCREDGRCGQYGFCRYDSP